MFRGYHVSQTRVQNTSPPPLSTETCFLWQSRESKVRMLTCHLVIARLATSVRVACYPTGSGHMWKVPQPASERGFHGWSGKQVTHMATHLWVSSFAVVRKHSWSLVKAAHNRWSCSGLFTNVISAWITWVHLGGRFPVVLMIGKYTWPFLTTFGW